MTPVWHFYCDMEGDPHLLTKSYWLRFIQSKFESQAGDENDRWETLRKEINLTEVPDSLEEYDGINHECAKQFILVISLPLLVRGHSFSVKVLEDIVSIRVPNLYKLQLGLPRKIEADSANAFFDCKARHLFLVVQVIEPVSEVVEVIETTTLKVSEAKSASLPVQIISSEPSEDLLFDVI